MTVQPILIALWSFLGVAMSGADYGLGDHAKATRPAGTVPMFRAGQTWDSNREGSPL